jgi:hypothetical protein
MMQVGPNADDCDQDQDPSRDLDSPWRIDDEST